MHKMCGKLRNNSGSSVVELSILMPVVLGIIFLLIFLFLDVINDGKIMGSAYCSLYCYDGAVSGNNWIELKRGKLSISSDKLDALYVPGAYTYEKRSVTYETEYGKCTERLRRWQFYGDAISKQGD